VLVTHVSRCRARLAREDGFSLVEILVALPISIVILMAIFTMMNVSIRQSGAVTDRVDAVQRGRTAMERVTRVMRSQVCPATTGAAFTSADSSSMTLYADMTGGASNPQRHTITFNSNASTLTEDIYAGTGTWPDLAFPNTPTQTRQLLANVTPVNGVPVFRYYSYDANGAVSTTPMTVPVTQAQLPRIVYVEVNFVANPMRTSTSPKNTTFMGGATVRTADPTKPTENARCL
jgi:Tfp pilus assembly protein PilV